MIFFATGAPGVIGGALMRRLWADPAWAGVRFLLAGRNVEALEALVAEAAAGGIEAEALALDLAEASAWPAALERIRLAGPIQGFALVAGMCMDGGLGKLEEAAWDRVWAVNTGFHAKFLQGLSAPGALAPGARGILVGSIVGSRGNHGQAAYAASKGAMLDLLPWSPRGLRLNVLLPPLVESPLMARLSDEAKARVFKSRLMDDADPAKSCAEAGAFLLGDAAGYVHRQAFHADSRVTALGWD
jgi:3-oxoacyl-[acyl-carrier protein] reductase